MTSRARRRRAPLPPGSKVLLAMAGLGFLGAGVYLGIQLAKPPPPPDFRSLPAAGSPPSSPPAEDVPAAASPSAAIDLEALVVERQPAPRRSERPRIALVIDDLGRSTADLDILADLGVTLTYSVLPFESQTPDVVERLRRRGAEILCHMPMEAKGGANPGPGALLLEMSPAELRAAARSALAAVPGAVGVNNHMGSGVSAELEAIAAVLSVLAEENLYYLDSRTSADTLGYSVARRLGIPAAERQVFLDADPSPDAIREQFDRLLEVARDRGSAIAIAHPYQETLDVLAAAVRAAEEQGFEFVAASSLLEGT